MRGSISKGMAKKMKRREILEIRTGWQLGYTKI